MKKLMVIILLGAMSSFTLQAAEIELTEVVFEEREPGVDPYITRLLVNKRYLRLDGGQDDGDYVLFDRVKGEIHNFNREERSEILIQRRPVPAASVKVDFVVEQVPLKDAPAINGIGAVAHRFFADGQLCSSSVNFNGLLPEVVTAWRQYKRLLQQHNLQTIEQIPQEVKTPCYLANNYLHGNAYLRAGFPVHVEGLGGRSKSLLNFRQVNKPAGLLSRLPDFEVVYLGVPK